MVGAYGRQPLPHRTLGDSRPLAIYDRVADGQHRIHAPRLHRGKHGVDVIRRGKLYLLHLQLQSRCPGFDRRDLIGRKFRPQDAHPCGARDRRTEQFQLLCTNLGVAKKNAGNVATWSRQAGHISSFQRVVVERDHDNGNGLGRFARRLYPHFRSHGEYRIDAAANETRGCLGKLLAGFNCRKVDGQVLSVDPSQFAQPLFERDVERCRSRVTASGENSDAAELLWLLSADHGRKKQRDSSVKDESAPVHYWITSFVVRVDNASSISVEHRWTAGYRPHTHGRLAGRKRQVSPRQLPRRWRATMFVGPSLDHLVRV